MAQFPHLSSPQQPLRRQRSWLRVLLIGIILFVITTLILSVTGNPNLYPTVILIGNFLVPVVFVAFLYDHRHLSALDPVTVASSFVLGGILGVLGASVLEAFLLPVPSNPNAGLPLSTAFLVGLIEEGCKIAAVAFLARRTPHTSEMDGLLLGGAVGMGFAALESTGYAFTVFLASGGHVSVSIIETVIRGLIAPFGHGTWTGILGAVLFQQSTKQHFRITRLVLLTYLFVSLLHGLWDGLPHSIYLIVWPGIPLSLTTLGIGLLGIILLIVVYRRSIRQQLALLRARPLP
ncbi:PrsW family intramembrane metalloprotease [Ktedonosporobacter rubrisoli]|uniref:PrsW family intramembrane metalloprotease n=1 Tax=Ktedonosporobacter rubrisoli TaxID=2509675 RepID=A0A4P6JJ47_KTERU|nr:PrsW family intramembrane metalloprotease [Ktedonosporobacter rubrisoli]QBD75125.1 PrsW family intramembrane metalloprotease [Ktedonosporobacter rubrisoli]